MGQVNRVMRKKCYRWNGFVYGEEMLIKSCCGGWKSLSTHCKCVFVDVQRIYGFLNFNVVKISREFVGILIFSMTEDSQAQLQPFMTM